MSSLYYLVGTKLDTDMKKLFKYIIAALLFGWVLKMTAFSQEDGFSRADSLRGTLSEMRSCYDVNFYDLEVSIDYPTQSIKGSNTLFFTATADFMKLQIDLFENMEIDHIEYEGNLLDYTREFGAVFILFPKQIKKGETGQFKIQYRGKPIIAQKPPWDGGFVWDKDENGTPWVGLACEGVGASLWWPMKDHLSDEPDSMSITLKLPPGELNELMAVSNGQLRSTQTLEDGTIAWEWFVSYPINSYNVTVNIADYAHIHDTYTNASGEHDLDYYVLKRNEDTARKHFAQVKPMMECYEQHFGEYPFWRDGYALVESSYWGMEHQSAVAYGNEYKNNAYNFDFIIIHETGHEWWGNNISCSDHSELWIHESFCTYAEAVYLECLYDYDLMIQYLIGQRKRIMNKKPIVGPPDVNYGDWGDADMYFKGSWMLHTFRSVLNNDELWFSILKDMNAHFAYQTTDTRSIIEFINQKTGSDYEWFFREYLYSAEPPTFEYSIKKRGSKSKLKYRWVTQNDDFKMRVGLADSKLMLSPSTKWQKEKVAIESTDFKIDTDKYYVKVKKVK